MDTSEQVELKGSRTHHLLREALAASAEAIARLAYFRQIAEIEGEASRAEGFRKAAEMEWVHAHGHIDLLKRAGDPATGLPLGPTRSNLEATLESEETQASALLTMSRTASNEGFHDIADWLLTAGRTKQAGLELLRGNEDGPAAELPARPAVEVGQ